MNCNQSILVKLLCEYPTLAYLGDIILSYPTIELRGRHSGTDIKSLTSAQFGRYEDGQYPLLLTTIHRSHGGIDYSPNASPDTESFPKVELHGGCSVGKIADFQDSHL